MRTSSYRLHLQEGPEQDAFEYHGVAMIHPAMSISRAFEYVLEVVEI